MLVVTGSMLLTSAVIEGAYAHFLVSSVVPSYRHATTAPCLGEAGLVGPLARALVATCGLACAITLMLFFVFIYACMAHLGRLPRAYVPTAMLVTGVTGPITVVAATMVAAFVWVHNGSGCLEWDWPDAYVSMDMGRAAMLLQVLGSSAMLTAVLWTVRPKGPGSYAPLDQPPERNPGAPQLLLSDPTHRVAEFDDDDDDDGDDAIV
jgi:hypothetical protein